MTTTLPVGADEPTSVFAPQLRAAMIAIMTTVALGAFEGLAVAAALPQVAADLGSVSLLPFVLATFFLTSGVATVVAGALVDRHGVGSTFRIAVALFVVGGLLCGVAQTMPQLIAARLLQGVGAGATNAVALSAVGLVFPARLVGRAFAANATVWGVMSVAGPAVAAGLLTVASWRWIFFVNVPLGLLALVLGARALPSAPPGGAAVQGRVTVVSLVLLTVFSGATLAAFSEVAWSSLIGLAVAFVAGWALLRRADRREDALLARRHVVARPLGPLGWAMALLIVGAIGTQLYVPLYVTAGRGVAATLGAWSVMFFVMGWTGGAQTSSRVMDSRDALTVTVLGTVLEAPALAAVGMLALVAAPLPLLFAALLAAGFGMGIATNAALTLLRQLAADEEIGRAVSAHQYIRSQGFAGGSAFGGAVLLLVVGTQLGDVEAVRAVLDGSATGAQPGVAGAVADGFAAAALVGAAVTALANVPMAMLRRDVRTQRAAEAAAPVTPADVG